jgi:hypothetical protein
MAQAGCPDGTVRSDNPPFDCVPISTGRKLLGYIFVASGVVVTIGIVAMGGAIILGAITSD